MSLSKAQCKGVDDETFKMFFGDSNDEEEPYNDEHAEAMKWKFCYECPIMLLCYEENKTEPYGLIGGATAHERRSAGVVS